MSLILILILLFLDQISKYLTRVYLTHDIKIIDNFFHLTYVKNSGAAFGIFSNNKILLLYLTTFIIIALVIMYFKFNYRMNLYTNFVSILFIAGAIGNLIDRIVHGYVTDMLHFYIFKYSFPVFNLADVYISLSVFFIIIFTIFGKLNFHEL